MDNVFPMNASPLNGLIQPERVIVRLAETSERRHLYRLRHEVYACELGQHAPSPDGLLSDALDEFNEYIVAAVGDVILGFVSITPPGGGRFSIDKYIARGEFPMLFSDRLYEVRLLTVLNPYRGRELALLLMYAAFRWIRKRGGERVVAIGRREVLSLYLRVGLEKLGRSIQSGAVRYELLSARTDDLEHRLRRHTPILNRLERGVDWRLDCPFREPAACFHGGAFFDGIGVEFEKLERRHRIINADVLDAWFPPAPGVVDALRENLEWAVRTSPPTACEGLLRAIANARSVPVDALVPGAGSSALIFLAFPRWLTPDSRVLLLDPTYGEYAHMLEQVVRCRVDRVRLRRERHYDLDGERLRHLLKREYDLVVLVNPNSPTGRHVPANVLKSILSNAPGRTRFWIDETYVEYAGAVESRALRRRKPERRGLQVHVESVRVERPAGRLSLRADAVDGGIAIAHASVGDRAAGADGRGCGPARPGLLRRALSRDASAARTVESGTDPFGLVRGPGQRQFSSLSPP